MKRKPNKKNGSSSIALSYILTKNLKKKSMRMNGHFFFQLQMKMSASGGPISDEGVDAQANYLFKRDKVFKEKFDTANRIKRIVPEVSGKKKLRNENDTVVRLVDENTMSNSLMPGTEDTKDNSEEELSTLDYLKKQHSSMTMEDKAACVAFLNGNQSSTDIIVILIFVLISFVIGMCIGSKLKLKYSMR
jgi:hypothetical protein